LNSGQYNDLLKNDDTQKPIELSEEDPEKLKKILAFLELIEEGGISFKYCRLCDTIVYCDTNSKRQAEVEDDDTKFVKGGIEFGAIGQEKPSEIPEKSSPPLQGKE